MADRSHLLRVLAIVDSLPTDADVAHTLLALEDAYVAVYGGGRFGLDVDTAKRLARESIQEILDAQMPVVQS